MLIFLETNLTVFVLIRSYTDRFENSFGPVVYYFFIEIF